MRSAALVAVTLGWLCAACLDTKRDKPGEPALGAWAGSTGSDKPPPAAASGRGAVSTAGASGSASSERSKSAPISQAARSGGATQPTAAGAPAVSTKPQLSGAGGAETPSVPAPKHMGDLVITELMVDPQALPDSQGEWFELYNATSMQLSLRDCKLDDGVKTLHSISEPLLIQPGEYATLARGPNPGFTPTAVVALSLTNTADSLAVVCAGVEIDRVSYNKAAGFPIKPGVTLSLDPDALSAQQNDVSNAWCPGQNLYNDDLGTPGRANPKCQDDEPDAGAEDE